MSSPLSLPTYHSAPIPVHVSRTNRSTASDGMSVASGASGLIMTAEAKQQFMR